MLRRMNLIGICLVLLFLSSGLFQREARQQVADPRVQSYIGGWANQGTLATQTLWQFTQTTAGRAQVIINGKPQGPLKPINTGSVPAADNFKLLGAGCTLTGEQAEAILKAYSSPAVGFGYAFVTSCNETKIDSAYVMAMFIHESGAGSNPAWAGIKGGGETTHNSGNIICAGYSTCFGRFRDYPGWAEGILDHFKLLRCYATGGGSPECSGLWTGKKHETIRDAINTWAPTSDGNDVNAYADAVEKDTASWRRLSTGTEVRDGPAGQTATQPAVLAPTDSFAAPGLELTGCLGINVRSAHESSPDLHEVSIAPGADWSFNEHWVINGDGKGVTCGVYYGGVCNQASRWSNVARHLGLQTESVYHGSVYDGAVPREDNLAIWSSGQRGGQDLVIRNTSTKTAHFQATIDGNTYYVKGWLDK